MRLSYFVAGMLLLCSALQSLGAQQVRGARAVWIGDQRYWISDDRRDTVLYRTPREAEYLSLLTDFAREDGVLDTMVAMVGRRLRMPGLNFRFQPCGTGNAFYAARPSRVTICAELLYDIENAEKRAGTSDAIQLTMDALRFFIAHEVGHAAMSRFDLPITGDEEIAADEFAMWLLDDAHDRAAMLAASTVFITRALNEEYTYARATEAHGLDGQRQARMRCWVVETPSPECAQRVARARRAWTRLLGPHRTIPRPRSK